VRLIPFLVVLGVVTAGCQPAQAPDPRVAAVMDRLAIDQLVAGDYPRALDARDWDAYVATFTDDGELVLGENRSKGAAAMKAFLGGMPAEPKVIHVISNLSYRIEGDTATGGAYWQDIGVGDTHGVLAAGHYVDALRKVGGTWKFTKREIVVQAGEAPPPK
jgi:ketosteroid isomerase-like protein